MNADLKDSFSRIKPVCDVVMVCPTQESITNFVSRVTDLKKDVVQELQQYLLFPFITHIKSTEIEKKFELQWKLVDGMRVVLEKVTVNSYEMCMKIETSLLQLVFDNSKPGMIAEVPEELKLSVIRCLTVLMLNIEKRFREKLLKTQVPLLAQAVFVAVHIAKLEKLRVLRLAAINCVTAHTMTHPQLTTDKCRVADPALEAAAVDMLASILPGVLAALQDVATCPNNPGHSVVVASLEAIHRILCLTMSDRFLSKKPNITAEDFAKSFRDTVQFYSQEQEQKEVSCKEMQPKEVPKRSAEWYRMASDKLTVITKSLISLRTHEHFKVRKELAVFCSRVLNECTLTMQPSQPVVLDILITLAKDEYPAVSEYCSGAVDSYFAAASFANRHRVMDNLCENFFVMLHGMPRVLNNVDSDHKLSVLNLLHGYIRVLCDAGRPQRLTAALSAHHNMRALTAALAAAAAPRTPPALARRHGTDVIAPSPAVCSWRKLLHLDTPASEKRLREICALLGAAESAELILDRLLEMFQQERSAELVSVMNWMMAGTTSESFISRVLDTYIAEDVWYPPLDVGAGEDAEGGAGTLDVTVYNPRAWDTDRVPGLYEGTVETRYTDITYKTPRRPREPGACASAAEAAANVTRCCLLADGLGAAAAQLGHSYRRHLMTTLCLLLERAGSKYELLHLAGIKALEDVAAARGLEGVPALIQHNADYFTHQVTVRLKRAWKTQSALEILSVVMEYSDPSLLDCLYGIVRDVLVQSCDKYYENNLYAYLRVFLNFVECIRKQFPVEEIDIKIVNKNKNFELDLVKDLLDYVENEKEAERLMDTKEFEEDAGKSVEEMYKEDMKNKEDDALDYDDNVTDEKPPLLQHVEVILGVLLRSAHFLSADRDDAVLAIQLLERGLPLLKGHDDQLLPLVYHAWDPIAARFAVYEPVVQRHALQLLATMAALTKDFLHARCVKEVLPHIYKFLRKSAQDSLKESSVVYCGTLACALQAAALRALPALAVHLQLRGDDYTAAMMCAQLYLSCKQPKMLQELAVEFFVVAFNYDDGATWYHLRNACNNRELFDLPQMTTLKLAPVIGTPFTATNKDLNANINAIFESIFDEFT